MNMDIYIYKDTDMYIYIDIDMGIWKLKFTREHGHGDMDIDNDIYIWTNTDGTGAVTDGAKVTKRSRDVVAAFQKPQTDRRDLQSSIYKRLSKTRKKCIFLKSVKVGVP
jgi:hypothetical protein